MCFFRRKAKKFYGLDVGNGAIKLVELRRDLKNNKLALHRFLIRPTPPDTVENGVIKNRVKLQGAIKALLKDFGARSLTVTTVLTGQNLIVRQVEVPKMPEEEFRKVLQLQADSYFGIPADELAADFQVIRELPDNRMLVLLVGSLKQPIVELVDLLKSCGIRTTRVDIEPLAALRSLRMTGALPPAPVTETTVVLDMGAGTSNLSIFQGDELQMVRVITVAGNDFTRAIAQAEQISWHEAEALKLQYGVTSGSPIYPHVEQTLQRLLRQVSISLEYYQVENRSALLRQLRIIGGSSQLLGLVDTLAENIAELFLRLDLKTPVVAVGNPCEYLQLAATATAAKELGPVLAVAIGLALGEVAADATN